MMDKDITKAVRRRRRRPSAELERLERLRRERVEQLQRVRDNERQVDEALGPFAEAVTAIEDAQVRLEGKLLGLEAALERKLADLARVKLAKIAEADVLKAEAASAADEEIAGWRVVMAEAVHRIRSADVGAAETAELLGITVKEQAALAREGNPDGHASAGSGKTTAADGGQAAEQPDGALGGAGLAEGLGDREGVPEATAAGEQAKAWTPELGQV